MSTKILALILSIFICVNCSNVFKPAANKNTDKALLYEAKLLLDEQKYTEAIAQLAQISSTAAGDYDVKITYASALAGACGMNFISFFSSLPTTGFSGGATLFTFLMNLFTDKITTPNYCTLAEAKIKDLGATAVIRSSSTGQNEANFFMAILSMSKVGSYLRTKADLDGTNLMGDGTVDATFNPCTNGTLNGFLSNEIDEIATGYALIIENLPYMLSSDNTTLTQIAQIGTAITAICPTCLVKDISEVASADLKNFRTVYRKLLASPSGLKTCADATMVTCCLGGPVD